MLGQARDLRTAALASAPDQLRFDTFRARLGWDRVIHEISSDPVRDQIAQLVGTRGGGHLRAVLNEVIPDELAQGTPLYLLLDDVSGTSLVAGWAWSRWTDEWMNATIDTEVARPPRRNMENVCTGFATGSSSLIEHAAGQPRHNYAPIVSLRNPEDPEGWHDLADYTDVSMRRARRIDVWVDEDVICIDAGFQDSASVPEGGRVAIHEYSLNATASIESGKILSVNATPRVLPFGECPGAVANIQLVVGEELETLRGRVIDLLPGPKGCTHLNDALRALAEVPKLLESLGITEGG